MEMPQGMHKLQHHCGAVFLANTVLCLVLPFRSLKQTCSGYMHWTLLAGETQTPALHAAVHPQILENSDICLSGSAAGMEAAPEDGRAGVFLHVGGEVIAALLVQDATGGQFLLIKQLWALHLQRN